MSMLSEFQLMAEYNQWMNRNIIEAASALTPAQLTENRGAFFGSITGTLNHTLGGDTIWLKRFANQFDTLSSLQPVLALPGPKALDDILYPDWQDYVNARSRLDRLIVDFVGELSDSVIESPLAYINFKGQPARKPFARVLLHFFNHQTHHRGQITTLLTQAGIEVGITDMLVLIGDE